MKRWFMGMVVIVLGVMSAVRADDPADDQEKIQGAWILVSSEFDGTPVPDDEIKARNIKMVFEKDRIVAQMGDRTATLGVFQLDPSKSPKTYDRIYPGGAKRLGIYKIEGNTLTICFAEAKKVRPTEFATHKGEETSLVVYKRE